MPAANPRNSPSRSICADCRAGQSRTSTPAQRENRRPVTPHAGPRPLRPFLPQQVPHRRRADVQRHVRSGRQAQGPIEDDNIHRQAQAAAPPQLPAQSGGQRAVFTEPRSEAQHRQQQQPGQEKANATGPDGRPDGDQPLGSCVVATPQKGHEHQAPGNGDVVFWLRHAASKPTCVPIANEIC